MLEIYLLALQLPHLGFWADYFGIITIIIIIVTIIINTFPLLFYLVVNVMWRPYVISVSHIWISITRYQELELCLGTTDRDSVQLIVANGCIRSQKETFQV